MTVVCSSHCRFVSAMLVVFAGMLGCKEEPKPSAINSASTSPASSAPSASSPMVSSTPMASTKSAIKEYKLSDIYLHVSNSIGPVKLGAAKTDVLSLSLKVHPKYSGMTVPYNVFYDKTDKVSRIEASLSHVTGDVVVHRFSMKDDVDEVGIVRIPMGADMATAKRLLGDCVDDPAMEGGTSSKCRGGKVIVSIGSGSPTETWIQTVP